MGVDKGFALKNTDYFLGENRMFYLDLLVIKIMCCYLWWCRSVLFAK